MTFLTAEKYAGVIESVEVMTGGTEPPLSCRYWDRKVAEVCGSPARIRACGFPAMTRATTLL